MKARIIAAVLFLLVYPVAVAVLMTFGYQESIKRYLVEHAMLIRAIAGLVSFCGLAMLIAEHQSCKLSKELKKESKTKSR